MLSMAGQSGTAELLVSCLVLSTIGRVTLDELSGCRAKPNTPCIMMRAPTSLLLLACAVLVLGAWASSASGGCTSLACPLE
jgi:hypothetical protein